MSQGEIIIKGARVHNLKNVSLSIPKNKLVVVTGLSGSGKSSLAFDTIYAEGQRRYAESLSAYARQFMEVRDKPDVDKIDGLSPTIAIDQRMSVQNPRSTVGTVTEIYDFLRLLFARTGVQTCPDCGEKVERYSPGEIIEAVRKLARGSDNLVILAPLVQNEKVVKKNIVKQIEQSGLERVRVNGAEINIRDLSGAIFEPEKKYTIELVTGRIFDVKKQNISEMVELALDLSNGEVVVVGKKEEKTFSTVGKCPKCHRVLSPLDIRNFSFNSPYGACARCTGLGRTMVVVPELVIPNPRLTLLEGAIQPWMRITGNQHGYHKLLAVVAAKHKFSLDVPVTNLPPSALKIILNGTGKELYRLENKDVAFPGVLEDLRERHLNTPSDYVRKEIEQYMREEVCPTCKGDRLRAESLAVKVAGHTIAECSRLSISRLLELMKGNAMKQIATGIAAPIVRELEPRLNNLEKVGLGYISLDRSMNTLSGGEATRVRLAGQLSTGLTGVIYVLDEPSVGLHPSDTEELITTLRFLRDLGNSVIVVEHDSAMMQAADYVIDVGPGAGVYGGEIVAVGTYAEIKNNKQSVTGNYLSGREVISIEKEERTEEGSGKKKKERKMTIVGAKEFNLKNVTVDIPLGKFVCFTGVSGSGKSTLVVDILGKALSKHFYRAKDEPGKHTAIRGIDEIDKVIAVDQSPIGRTPRSNPATYTGIFTIIRDLYAELPESRMRSYDAGKFSFNVKGGGRCEACAGEGYVRIPMQFLSDVFVVCNECDGLRYNQEALEVHYHNKNIAEVLNMTVEEAFRFFSDLPTLRDKLSVLREVGLGYVKLGQPATTLSGGEAQRIKLATELSRASTGSTLYILDEPTTGLHFGDVQRLLQVLHRLSEKGNTVVVIEHNVDIIRNSDWVIDLGPKGGEEGGEIVFAGLPADLKKFKKSATAKYL